MIPSFKHGIIASSMPKAAAAASGFDAGDLVFNDFTTALTNVYGNMVTATKSGTIYISVDASINAEHFASFTKNGVEQTFTSFGTPTTVVYGSGGETGSFNITAGDTLQWYGYQSGAPVGGDSFVVTIRNANSTGTIIDTLTINRLDTGP